MNKLKFALITGGINSFGLILWAWLYYGYQAAFLDAVLLGAITVSLPSILSRGIFRFRFWVRNQKSRFGTEYRDGTSILESTNPINRPDHSLDRIKEHLKSHTMVDDVRWEHFDEGRGLSIIHSGFHNIIIRIGMRNHLVITGATARIDEILRAVGKITNLQFKRKSQSPFQIHQPVRGAPRVFLSILIVGMFIGIPLTVGAGAYSSEAFNPVERTVLVGIDLQAQITPSVDSVDHRLNKAAFLISILGEEATEIQWSAENAALRSEQISQTELLSAKINLLLMEIDSQDLSTNQRVRREQLFMEFESAEDAVHRAIVETSDAEATQNYQYQMGIHCDLDGCISQVKSFSVVAAHHE